MTPLTFKQIPILKDNYVTLIHHNPSGQTAVIDAGDAEPIMAECEKQGWKLTHLFITHHHWDHSDGIVQLIEQTSAKLYGFAGDQHRLPPLDKALNDNDRFDWNGTQFQVMHLMGHTNGHIVYYLPQHHRLFCGDVMFLMGCGRLFEGTAEQMFESFQRIKALPPETLICCGHEYTVNNGEFLIELEPENPAIKKRLASARIAQKQGNPTVPAPLSLELETNLFLRAKTVEEFANLRNLRNQW